jgi:NAD(P)-dependent dehydrogenase (short-subunit alcohol dehydrogenase family)
MDLDLKGKRAVVTGGSRGIGKAVARLLGSQGADCAICARNEAPLVQSARELADANGTRVFPFVADTSNERSVAEFIENAASALGGIDILVNGAARRSGPVPEDLEHMTAEIMAEDFREKVIGYFLTAKAAAPHLKANGWGRIVNIGGMAGRTGGAFSAGARNVAVVNLTKGLALELGPHGVNVNAVHPGRTLTENVRAELEEQSQKQGKTIEEVLRQPGAALSVTRPVTAEDVAQVIVFLASPASFAINGQVIDVSGGLGRNVFY